jgi:hypothetical protein
VVEACYHVQSPGFDGQPHKKQNKTKQNKTKQKPTFSKNVAIGLAFNQTSEFLLLLIILFFKDILIRLLWNILRRGKIWMLYV